MPPGFSSADFYYLLPELILTAGSLLVLVLDVTLPRAWDKALSWVTVAVLALAGVALLTGVGQTLTIDLKYGPNRERSIAGVRRVSKPGLRVYAKSTNLPKVLGGLGVAIISTSTGLLTDKQAHEKGVGGEVLAYVW